MQDTRAGSLLPKDLETGVAAARIFVKPVAEIAMSRKMIRTLHTAVLCGALLPVASAVAAQGPGTGMGSAGDLTRMAMAILVYGTAAVIVGAGLIGALRRR
jgi:hypothetical protein